MVMKNWKLLCIFMLVTFFTTAQKPESQETSSQQKVHTKLKIKVFPNPATNVVNILGLLNSSSANIIITDISGNLVLKHQWAIHNSSIGIPIPNLNSGIYMVAITSEEQKVQTKFYKN